MRILHGEGYNKEALMKFRSVVYSNIVKGMKVNSAEKEVCMLNRTPISRLIVYSQNMCNMNVAIVITIRLIPFMIFRFRLSAMMIDELLLGLVL